MRCSRCLRLRFPLELGVAILAVEGDSWAQLAFPYVSAAFGMIAVGAVWHVGGPFPQPRRQGRELLSRPHLVLGLSLPPDPHHGAEAAARLRRRSPCNSPSTCSRSSRLSTLFFAGFERPILAARPYYGAARRRAVANVAPQREPRRWRGLLAVALGLAAIGAGVLARNAFMADKPYAFYSLLVATAVLVFALAETVRLHTTGAARCGGARVPSVCARAAGAPTLSTAARPDCRWSPQSLRPPIPIAPRTPIRPLSRPGGSIISTNGSARTGSARRSMRRTRKRSCLSCLFPAARGACSTPRSTSTISASAGRTWRATRATHSASSRSASRRPSGRPCAMARSPGPSCCRICSISTPHAAAKSRSSTPAPRPTRSKTISSACAATSCPSSLISSSARTG